MSWFTRSILNRKIWLRIQDFPSEYSSRSSLIFDSETSLELSLRKKEHFLNPPSYRCLVRPVTNNHSECQFDSLLPLSIVVHSVLCAAIITLPHKVAVQCYVVATMGCQLDPVLWLSTEPSPLFWALTLCEVNRLPLTFPQLNTTSYRRDPIPIKSVFHNTNPLENEYLVFVGNWNTCLPPVLLHGKPRK